MLQGMQASLFQENFYSLRELYHDTVYISR